MRLNVTGGHAPGIQSDNFVVKAGEAALPFGDNNRIEAGFAITGNGNIEIPELALDSLFIAAVTGVAGFLVG